MKKNMLNGLLFTLLASATVISGIPAAGAYAQEITSDSGNIVINEINSSPDDWVEFVNGSDAEADISGYEIRDNSDDHRWKFAEGTKIGAGEILVVDAKTDGMVYDDKTESYEKGSFESAIGIGSGDSIRLYDRDGNLIDQYSWTEHASYDNDPAKASYGRYPDASGDFVLMKETKGKANECFGPKVVINEVQSKDPTGGPDWIELANPSSVKADISGMIIKDNDDGHVYKVPEGTVIEAGGFLVIDDTKLGFGLGKGDSVRIFEGDTLVGETTWENHTNPTWGLYPDANGKEYRNTTVPTPGEANMFEEVPEEIEGLKWPGPDEVKTVDGVEFLEDSSGLDFDNGKLYAIDNGAGKFWIMDAAKDGKLTFAKGFEEGKRIRYAKDAENPKAKGPDTEGITVDGNGMVYAASERDNSNKGVNYCSILMVNPDSEGKDLIAEKEWNLADSLPEVSANMGIESVEWISNEDAAGRIFDKNTGTGFDPANYKNAYSGGIFFVALEDNGHVYAYVLNDDETAVQIADIDSGLGGAMAMDYDTYEDVLWVMADDGYGNKGAKLVFNGTENPETEIVNPPVGLDVSRNNEGFAIASKDYTENGVRPVYRFCDGVTEGALTYGGMFCDYTGEDVNPDGQNQGGQTPEKPDGENEGKPSGGHETSGAGGGHGASGTGSDVPKTGDRENIISILVLLVLSGAGLELVRFTAKKDC